MQSTFMNRETDHSQLAKSFIAALFISGLTAIPVEQELTWLQIIFHLKEVLVGWMVLIGIQHTSKDHPFLFMDMTGLPYILYLLFFYRASQRSQ
jgi:hypothetical protein